MVIVQGLSKDEIPKFMLPVDKTGLVSLTGPHDLPPVEAHKPVSTETNVVEPPLPSVVSKVGQPFDSGNGFISSASTPNGQPKSLAEKYINILIILGIT
ncbi:hypothetical protein Vadar_021781 [Vaccinium darrowii]|uniref:Uncharacterized protein n=1 Tax=Vaccinium darrowii TaxID=229202 RepID=A0ACB7XK79_9ERIC|nr:hypothetical protein Vadar_021781 [Vaccinium darrowii]